MALPIRPPVWPPAPTPLQPGRDGARASAQKAFFEAALAGKVVAQAQTPDSAARPAPTVRAAPPSEPKAADKIPRPGSIIDIWV